MKTDLPSEYLPTPETETQPAQPPLIARKLFDLQRPAHGEAAELLRHRYLSRGGGLLLCGPTGIGKSALSIQCAIAWALAKGCFGIEAARPLKSLFIQAENDDGDMAEMRDGVIRGLQLTPAEIESARENILIIREDTRTATRFFLEVVRPLLEAHKPDLLWIDPALAYLGGEVSSQKDVGAFLRNGLNPLLHEFDCGGVVIHHTNKPASGVERPKWEAGDFAYLGSGSAEWGNWARGVLALRSIGSHEVFELRAGKRGSRLGWLESDGATKSFARYLAHAKEPGVICWREVEKEEAQPTGRPKKHDIEEFLDLLPDGGLTAGKWQKLAKEEYGMSETAFHNYRRELQKADRIIKSKTSGKWQPIKKA